MQAKGAQRPNHNILHSSQSWIISKEFENGSRASEMCFIYFRCYLQTQQKMREKKAEYQKLVLEKTKNRGSHTNRKSYCITRHAGQQGARHSAGNRPDGEKCTTGTNFAHPIASDGNHSEEQPQQGPLDDQSLQTTKKRAKWQSGEDKS